MGKLINMAGKRFGRLIVIKRSYPNAKNKDLRYLCKCDCGTEKIILGKSLRRKDTKSCGCLHNEMAGHRNRLESGLSNMRAVISGYKKKARIRGLEWNLMDKQFKEITQKDCYYCGAKPNNVAEHQSKNGKYIYNGLDRVDNSKGYTTNNIVSCCRRCNIAKNDMTLKEFENWIREVSNKISLRRTNERL